MKRKIAGGSSLDRPPPVVGLMRNRGVVCISLGLLALLVLVIGSSALAVNATPKARPTPVFSPREQVRSQRVPLDIWSSCATMSTRMHCLPKRKPTCSARPNERQAALENMLAGSLSCRPDSITRGTCCWRLPPGNVMLGPKSKTRRPATKAARFGNAIEQIDAEHPHALYLGEGKN